MRRALCALGMIVVLIAAALVWQWQRRPEPASEKAQEKQTEEESRLSRDESGRTIVKMDRQTQAKMGLALAKALPAEQAPELTAYGKVLDPGALAALMTELASAEAAAIASGNELVRLRTLAAQQNASERALQTAQAVALRDHLAVQSAKDRLALTWGEGIAAQTNLPAFIQPLTALAAVLVRVDLPIGEALAAPPKAARIAALSGDTAEGKFLGTTAHVDPQTLGRGAIFLIKPNVLRLMSGEPVTAHLQLAGTPLPGVIVPHEAIVRSEGRGWAYLRSADDAFVRTKIPLDHPLDGDWFVRSGVTTNDSLVVTGAQTLLSEELKSALKSD